jgi:hypothetical protein
MSYIGEIKPQSQQYTTGMQKVDEMLLGGDPAFPGQFAEQKKAQYKQQVEDPYGAAKAAREGQKAQAVSNTETWKKQMQDYLGGENKAIQDILAKQQEQEKEAADLTFSEWQQMNAEAIKGKPPDLSQYGTPDINKLYNDPEYYKQFAERSGYNTPSMGTAATEYGSNADKMADYNALASILNVDQLMPTNTYNPGQWKLKGLPGM